MEFVVSRTSMETSPNKPCEEAYKKTCPVIVEWDWWPKKEEVETWFVQLSSLEELLSFTDKYGGKVILMRNPYNHNFWKVEIYDNYRE